MPALALSCSCDATRWVLARSMPGKLITCYCNGCQSYIRHLCRNDPDKAGGLLSPEGGTLILQTLPDSLTIPRGADHLRALRMTSKGVVRWYAACCDTPVANTIATPALPFVGMVLPQGTEAFGRCRTHVHTNHAARPVRQRGMAAAAWGLIGRGIAARLRGQTASPFFAEGTLVRQPEVLDREARQAAGWR
ncbi:DUF6151 family protein [Roseivivax sp. CAU 1753]